ncbi:hypothetical protein Tco_0441645 [Tanacetum coccineum]
MTALQIRCMRWRLHVPASAISDKVAKLDAALLEMALHLEEIFYPHLFTTISGRRWLLTSGVKLAIVKCLNSQEYLMDLGFAISRAIKKGMQDGLSASIDHGKAEAPRGGFPFTCRTKHSQGCKYCGYYGSAPPGKSPCDALGMSDLQPDIEQLTLPIHRPGDQVFLGETFLSFALSVAHSRVKRIRENVPAQRIPAAVVSTTSLSTTFASASSFPPITMDAYEIVNVDG